MKVLLLGATGNLGSRLLPALLAHRHQVIVYVRSERKLRDLIPASLLSNITIITGDATDTPAITSALVDNKCTALINSAGQAAIFPWQAPRMQDIINAVASAAVEASEKLGYPLRCWFLGGLALLDMPGMEGAVQLGRYIPLFSEHALTYACLSAKPASNLKWSMLCPSTMTPTSQTIALLETPRGNSLSASADVPPHWQNSYFHGIIPFVGPLISALGNAPRYGTKLEDNADFIAADLESGDARFVGKRVGVFDKGEGKVE